MAERDYRLNKTIRKFLKEIQKKYRLDAAYLYGSFARGTFNRWSDIDVAIISPDFSDNPFEDRLLLMQIAATIDDRLEPRPFKRGSFDHNDPLVYEIQKTGIQLI